MALGDGAPHVGWDQRRFAAPAHHTAVRQPDGGTDHDDGPALEASLSRPTSASHTIKLPADARQSLQSLSKDLKSLADEQTTRIAEAEQFDRSLTALKLDPGAVSYRAEIKSCLELRQSFIEAKEQLPERQRQREAMKRLIDRELAELRPGWTHDDLRAGLAFYLCCELRDGRGVVEIPALGRHGKRDVNVHEQHERFALLGRELEPARDALRIDGARLRMQARV